MSAPPGGLEAGELGDEKQTCACAWHFLRIRAGVLLPPPPPGAAVALRCVAARESRQFSARLGARPHPVGDGTRVCAWAPAAAPPGTREVRCLASRCIAAPGAAARSRLPSSALPLPRGAGRPSVITHRPAQRSRAAVRRPAHSRSRPSGLPSPQAARTLEGGSSLYRHRRGQAGR